MALVRSYLTAFQRLRDRSTGAIGKTSSAKAVFKHHSLTEARPDRSKRYRIGVDILPAHLFLQLVERHFGLAPLKLTDSLRG